MKKFNLSNIKEKSLKNEVSSEFDLLDIKPVIKLKPTLEEKIGKSEMELQKFKDQIYKGKKNTIQDPFYEDFKKIVNGKIGYHAHKKLTKMYEEKQREIFKTYMKFLAKKYDAGSIDIMQTLKFFGKSGFIGFRKQQELEFIRKVKNMPRKTRINFHDYIKEFQYFFGKYQRNGTPKIG